MHLLVSSLRLESFGVSPPGPLSIYRCQFDARILLLVSVLIYLLSYICLIGIFGNQLVDTLLLLFSLFAIRNVLFIDSNSNAPLVTRVL